MREVKLLEITSTITTTSCTPLICNTDDGIYYVKVAENIDGPRLLINEYIAYSIAKMLGLPIPKGAFVQIDGDFEFSIDNQSKKLINPIGFGLRQIKNVTPLIHPRYFSICSNKENLLPIIVFDHILDNTDREFNIGNLLFSYTNSLVYIIDHGRIFKLGSLWNQNIYRDRPTTIKLKDFSENSLYGKIRMHINLSHYRDACIELFSRIRYDDLKDIVEGIPKEWECSKLEKENLLAYLFERYNKYPEIIDMIVNNEGEVIL
jgi:hypothetical protein